MNWNYTVLVNSKKVFITENYDDALEEYFKRCTNNVIVVKLLDVDFNTALEYRPSSFLQNGHSNVNS